MIIGIDMFPPRIKKIYFQGNLQITIITCYSPTKVSKETEVDTFYTQLTDTIREIPKHNVLIIGGDFNAHLGQDNGYKFAYHQTTNRNGQMLNDFLIENNMICLNTKLQKWEEQLWTHLSPNNVKSQIDYLMIN